MPWLLMTAAKMISDQKKEQSDRYLATAKAATAPWTGDKPQAVQQADPVGTAMQGGMAYMGMKQNEDSQASQQRFNDAQLNYMNAASANMKSQNPWDGMATMHGMSPQPSPYNQYSLGVKY